MLSFRCAGYLSYLAGVSGAQNARDRRGELEVKATGRWRVTGAAALFVAGFTVVFVAATVSVFGVIGILTVNRELLQRIGGVVTILMGLVFVGLIPVLQRETRPRPPPAVHPGRARPVGATFGLGWTPCLGPTLTGVLSVAAGTQASPRPAVWR